MAFKKLKYWFDEELAILLAEKIVVNNTTFNSKLFIEEIKKGVTLLELKDRVELIADKFEQHLPGSYKNKIEILMDILGPENKEETGMFNHFYWIMPIAKFVEKYGLEDFETSLNAIEEVTKRNTGEYAIRPFIRKDFEKVMKQIAFWAKSDNFHIRRLASEGIRPRLPWATKLDLFIDNPVPVIKILNQLKDDKSKYVQNSVANNLNDILKDNYEIGKRTVDKWLDNAGKERKWIIKHALRNQIKSENEWAIELLFKMKKK